MSLSASTSVVVPAYNDGPAVARGARVVRRPYNKGNGAAVKTGIRLAAGVLLPNGFSTPTTTTMAFLKAGYSVRFEPIEARERQGASKIRFGPDGVRFFLILLKVITIFSPLRMFVPITLAAFSLGAGYALWTAATQSHVTNSSVLLITLSVVIFLIGLVSEQISTLRFGGRFDEPTRPAEEPHS